VREKPDSVLRSRRAIGYGIAVQTAVGGGVTRAAADARPSAPRITTLDSTRGIAALVVCLYHCLSFVHWPDGHTSHLARGVASRLLDGMAAVDFFFVLSGFVLALPYLGTRARPLEVGDFLVRRIVRIMPTYWAGLTAAIALRTLLAPQWSFLGIAKPLGMDWTAPLTRHDLFQHYSLIFGLNLGLIDGPIWSLGVEMQVSLILPFFVAAFTNRPGLRTTLAILAVATLVPYIAGGSGYPFMPLFILGVALACYSEELKALFARQSKVTRYALWITAAALVVNRSLQPWWRFPDLRQEFISGAGSGLAILLVVSQSPSSRLLTNAPVKFLGQISYSFYLMHLPFVLATFILMRRMSSPDWLTIPVALVAAGLGSTALFYAVERPSIGASRRTAGWLSRQAPETSRVGMLNG
jgi:peptidoglycan/LPS O-acetylase OafA/YrhL